MSLGKTMVTLLTATWPCVIGVYFCPEFQHPTAFRVTCNSGSGTAAVPRWVSISEISDYHGGEDVDRDILGIT
jgi:hypothetical protein